LQRTESGANPIKLYLTAAQSTYNVGDTILVTIREDSLTTAVNSVGVDLSYPAGLLQYQSSSTSGSAFTTTVQNTGGSGGVHIAVGILAGSNNGDQLIGTVTFTVVASGTAAVTFDVTSGIARASDSVDVCQAKIGTSFNLL
jgi:hypothetical protein